MDAGRTIRFDYLWAPLSCLYGVGVRCRNQLFDKGILREEQYGLPVIGVGNLAVGGTGKTPLTEYLIRKIKDQYRVAVLSRGYKRSTSGFLLATSASTSREIGDEPYQMKWKFPDIQVAVDANRRRGIRRLLAMPEGERPEVIVLDDVFQHRYVQPSLRILLTDSHRLYVRDKLLPVGRLREPAEGAKRADVVIVTKCDPDLSSADRQAMAESLCLSAHQRLYFSYIVYEKLEPVFPDHAQVRMLDRMDLEEEVLVVTGIASPQPLEEEVRKHTRHMISFVFPDHHAFTPKDIQKIQREFERMQSPSKLILVTEKDVARLRDCPFLPAEWFSCLYSLPITVGFFPGEGEPFDALIRRHVKERLNNHI